MECNSLTAKGSFRTGPTSRRRPEQNTLADFDQRVCLWETGAVHTFLPSGRQLGIRDGKYAATVTEVGGGLREFSYAGIDLVDGFAADALVDGSRGQVLAPWPNRLRDGCWELG
jgi:hypothetical protein